MIDLRRLAAAACLFLVSGCSMLGASGDRLERSGLVVSDEPQAAQIGAAVLAHGGNAADAAAATYFALSVTYPVAAGLGGGGLCIVHTGQTNASFEFLPREAKRGGAYAIPGNVSGFSRLQASYGRLPWQRVISPAESLAAAGFSISQSLASRLADSANAIRLDAALSAEFLNESGEAKSAGTPIIAPALAQTLSQLRMNGPEALYRGAPAAQIVSYSTAQGGAITPAELSSFAPERLTPGVTRVGGLDVYYPSPSTDAGRFAGTLLSRLVDAQGRTADTARLAVTVPASAKESLPSYGVGSIPQDLGSTGFAVVDMDGMAVACGVTMNGPFGSGHTVPSTGITLANAPDSGPAGYSGAFLTPLIALSDKEIALVGTGTGGPDGSAGIVHASLALSKGNDVVRPGVLPPTTQEPYEMLNVIGCYAGVCAAVPDSRGYGLGAAGG